MTNPRFVESVHSQNGKRKRNFFHAYSTPRLALFCLSLLATAEWRRQKCLKNADYLVGAVGIEPTTSPV
jgi:hypothetical protein